MGRSPELAIQLWFEEIGPPPINFRSSSKNNPSSKSIERHPTLRAALSRGDFLINNEGLTAQLELSITRPHIGRRVQGKVDLSLERNQGGYPGQKGILREIARVCQGMDEILYKYEILIPAA